MNQKHTSNRQIKTEAFSKNLYIMAGKSIKYLNNLILITSINNKIIR